MNHLLFIFQITFKTFFSSTFFTLFENENFSNFITWIVIFTLNFFVVKYICETFVFKSKNENEIENKNEFYEIKVQSQKIVTFLNINLELNENHFNIIEKYLENKNINYVKRTMYKSENESFVIYDFWLNKEDNQTFNDFLLENNIPKEKCFVPKSETKLVPIGKGKLNIKD